MVHDQEEAQHPHARKRSYPFIQWVNPGSSPPRKQSPDRTAENHFHPLPSPPLQSNKYKIFKQDLDRFGGRLKAQANNGGKVGEVVEEKHRVRKTSWAEADRKQGGESGNKQSTFRVDVPHQQKAYSDDSQNPEKKKKEKHVPSKARENEMHVSSSGQDYDAESVKSADFDEEEPVSKRPKYSVEIREIPAEEDEKEYRPNIAESIKLRKPSESRRNKSESYDESDARTIKKILSSGAKLDDNKLSLTNNCRLTNRTLYHPYLKKTAEGAPMAGTKVKMLPRSTLLQSSLESSQESKREGSKVYIQLPQGTSSASSRLTSDRNHNKVRDTGYDSRKVTISNIAGEVKYKKTVDMPQNSHSLQRPSSTVVSSSTEVNDDEETEEEDEHDGQEEDVKDGERAGPARVTLQPSSGGLGGGFGTTDSQGYWSSAQQKERPTPYTRDGHHTFKQVCRSRKFK